jgi:hypothetical protein
MKCIDVIQNVVIVFIGLEFIRLVNGPTITHLNVLIPSILMIWK